MLTVQATVRDWDAGSRGGTVLLDDGRVLSFDGEAVQVRALRLGQRVLLRIDGERISALTIVTLPLH